MEAKAVDLDNQPVCGPAEVDRDPGDHDVRLRLWHGGCADELEEAKFELGLRPRRRTAKRVERRGQGFQATPPSAPGPERVELRAIDAFQPLGGLEREAEALRTGNLGVVEHGPLDRRHGDPIHERPVGVVDRARRVAADAARPPPSPPWHHDIDGARRRRPELPKRRCGPVAEQRPWPGCEHGGHPTPAQTQPRVADGIHAAMDPMQPSRLRPSADRARAVAEAPELTRRYDAVLLTGQPCESPVIATWRRFCPICGNQMRHVRHKAKLAGKASRVGADRVPKAWQGVAMTRHRSSVRAEPGETWGRARVSACAMPAAASARRAA